MTQPIMHRSSSLRFTLYSLCLLLVLSGCSNIKGSTSPSKEIQTSKKLKDTRDITVLDLSTLQPFDTMIPQLAKHKAVLVGELHTNYGDHLNQLAVIKSLHKKWGTSSNKIAIGLEMIQQPYQRYLDDYIAGNIDEKSMLRGTEWYDRWRYDYRLYRPIFNYAKQNNIPLLALNIPKELTRRISKVGIKGLNTKERAQLPKTLVKSNPAYRARLQKVFAGHMKTSSKAFEQFLEAQLAWDEGMASQAAKYLKIHPSHRIVILAGEGHLINREGIPDRLERRIQSKPAVILNNVNETPHSTQGDYLLFSPEVKLPPVGRLGIAMEDTEKGVVIRSLLHHGAAAKAGLAKGDIIQRLDNLPIKTSTDIKLWAMDKKPGDTITTRIKRKHSIKSYKVTLGKKLPSLNSHTMKSIHGK